MNKELYKEFSSTLFFKLANSIDKNKNDTDVLIPEKDKVEEIKKIQKEYIEKIETLKKERDKIVIETISFLEKKKIEEIMKKL